MVSERNKWEQEHAFGRWNIPLAWIKPIDASWLVIRDVDWEHVKSLAQEFTANKRYHDDISTVLWLEDHDPRPSRVGFDIKQVWELMPKRTLNSFIGGHTMEALREMHSQGVEGIPNLHQPNQRLFICTRTAKNITMIEDLGRTDNVHHNLTRKVDDREMVKAAHVGFKRIFEQKLGSGSKQENTELKKFKDRLTLQYARKDNSMVPIFSFARRMGRCWELLEAIIDGQYKKKGDKNAQVKATPLKSISVFMTMQGLEDKHCIPILERVTKGFLTLETMREQFADAKLTFRIREAILEALVMSSWEMARAKYPLTTATDFILSWRAAFKECASRKRGKEKKKEGKSVPDGFLAAVMKRQADDIDVAERRKYLPSSAVMSFFLKT